MLFNSYIFIFGFLPAVFFGFYRLGKYHHKLAALWLAAASLFFYGWWDARFVGLLLGSVTFNYSAAYLIAYRITRQTGRQAKLLLIGAITVNLILLGYFKYANFFVENLNYLTGTTLFISKVVLPLGISFYTFTQITFLVDTYQGKVKEYNFVHYLLFVTYFPHLIAGPILHHKEMMAQFDNAETYKFRYIGIATGATVFIMGLFKKVIFADGIAQYATPVFNAAAAGGIMQFYESWSGAVAYSLQLYFDFSGYSDMAIGISLLFGVRLPLNFNSPYKATSIIDFWQRWHMTLSRFLKEYLYIPLGGNRKGVFRRYVNLIVTMLLGGLWHGAGWTFLIWGGLHGIYLALNHFWRSGCGAVGVEFSKYKLARLLFWLLTWIAILIAWVFFRADRLSSALAILKGMSGANGLALPVLWKAYFAAVGIDGTWLSFSTHHDLFNGVSEVAWIITLLCVVWFCPNTQQIMNRYAPALDGAQHDAKPHIRIRWSPTPMWGGSVALLFVFCLLNINKVSEFLYFQF